MKTFIAVLVGLFLVGCGSTPIEYRGNTNIPVDEAKVTVEKMTMLQHAKWRPNYIVIEDDYIGWDFGTTTKESGGAVGIGFVAIGNSRSSTKAVTDRIYYSDISDTKLIDWTRKMKQWYAVSITPKYGSPKVVLRTKHKEQAMEYIDALRAIIASKAIPASPNEQ